MCGTVYGDMHFKDLLGSIMIRPSLPKKHYNGLNQTKPGTVAKFNKKSAFARKKQLRYLIQTSDART